MFEKVNIDSIQDVHLAANERTYNFARRQRDREIKSKELAESYHSEHKGCLVLVARQDSIMLYIWASVRTYSCPSPYWYTFGKEAFCNKYYM